MKKPWLPHVEAFLARSAAIAPSANERLYINCFAEFANGDLAQDTPTPGDGEVKLLDIWVVGFIGDSPRYSSFSNRGKEESSASAERLRQVIRNLPDVEPLTPSFSAHMYSTGHKTIAAYAFGKREDGTEIELLLRHPLASQEEAMACLKMTVRKSDATDPPPDAATKAN
jgi:hypothetical protein